MITVTDNQFYTNRTWSKPLVWKYESAILFPQWLEYFDQNGYRLTHLEQEYSHANDQPFVLHVDEKSLRKTWMTADQVTTGPNLNHAFLFERKGYEGEALDQLKQYAEVNNLLYKLINYKGKWGIDLSMDYVDAEGNSMEILHFEYDSYNLQEINVIKQEVEQIVANTDWAFAAKKILARKAEWMNLEFFEQSKWKTDFFSLPAERFKMNAWE